MPSDEYLENSKYEVSANIIEANQLQLIENTVPGKYRCQTENAQWLCLWDVNCDVKDWTTFDIGGTYSADEPDVWFHYTLKKYNCNVLISIFALHRRRGVFSIGISDTNKLDIANMRDSNYKHYFLSNKLTWKSFASVQCNTNYHIKTYCINEEDIKFFENKSIWIPISIKLELKELGEDMTKKLKGKHIIAIKSFIKQKKRDFILESSSRKQYPAYKLLLIASSPVLRDILRKTETNVAFIDINDKKMDLMLQWAQDGVIENIEKQNPSDVIEVADQFKFNKLIELMTHTLTRQVNIDNAIDLAVFSKKYNLEDLQKDVFQFIKNNEQVLETPGWKNLTDVNLTKALFESINMKK